MSAAKTPTDAFIRLGFTQDEITVVFAIFGIGLNHYMATVRPADCPLDPVVLATDAMMLADVEHAHPGITARVIERMTQTMKTLAASRAATGDPST